MAWQGWEHLGVRGRGNLPPTAGEFSGPLLVCGGGRTLWDDLARYTAPAHVMAVNWAGCLFPRPFEHWASLHPDHLVHMLALRRLDHPSHGHIWTHTQNAYAGIELSWRLALDPACSGFFAALVGLALGYAPVILAGCPEDLGGHFYDPPGEPGGYTNNSAHEAMWLSARDTVFAGRVRSLSGRTRDWLGEPDGL